ncbi:hypothetical protein ACHAWF_005506 [Thalassiosira exigua]
MKGLSGDAIRTALLRPGEGTVEDDRREFGEDPEWLQEENFLCAFTAPELLATLDTEYKIEGLGDDDVRRLLTVWDREHGRSSPPLLGPVDLADASGREATSGFFTELCGRRVRCIHMHQFGNTSAGVKHNMNECTVRQLS